MYEIVKAAYDIGFDGPIRPDHGRMIWAKKAVRAMASTTGLGANYICGLWMLLTAHAVSYKGGTYDVALNRQSLKKSC